MQVQPEIVSEAKRIRGRVDLVYREAPGPAELDFIKIVNLLGGVTEPIKLTGEAVIQREYLERTLPPGGCLALSAETLRRLNSHDSQGAGLPGLLGGLAESVFVYGFEPEHSEVLRNLTSGALVGVEAVDPAGGEICVAEGCPDICKQLSGLRFALGGTKGQSVFAEGAGRGACVRLSSWGERPFFVRVENQNRRRLFLACGPVADLDAKVPRGQSTLEFFPSLAPALMFLQGSSNEGLWHNDAPHACFIVDDPLLRRRYGFLEYQSLLRLMEREQFCTAIAFIPWNYDRSEREVAKLFAAHPHRFSLCVHGCDHTRGEFGAASQVSLREKARQAVERMRLHRERSGLGFDDVMVFPQGIFSTAAMRALRECGYLAAVNSTPYPVDEAEGLALGDLLGVAVTRHSNVPLFTRRYPQSIAELAFDLFLGKPALVVEHHGFFRDGYNALARTVQELYRLDGRLRWASLATTCSRACLKKMAGNGDIHVLFFTDRFVLQNDTERQQNYVLFRRAIPGEGLGVITINGRRVDTTQEVDCVKAQLTLGAGEAGEIRVEYGRPELSRATEPLNRMHKSRVFIRRSLSEFRDNYVDRSRILSAAVRRRSAKKRQLSAARWWRKDA